MRSMSAIGSPLRIGILGAARIAPQALVRPARKLASVTVGAVAARDMGRAEAFARKHHITAAYGSYDELIADTAVDAIYNPLPNGLHGRWTIAALEAGKHVLCEKPFTANAEEAREVVAAAERTRLVCMEAFHYRYHPLVARMVDIVRSGELGSVRRIDTWMCIPLLPKGDIRWNLALAGGTTMDVGCYAIHLLRTLAGEEPTVVSATAAERVPGVDRTMRAEMTLPSGATGSIDVSMFSSRLLAVGAKVTGDLGSMKVFNPYAPQLLHSLNVTVGGHTRRERLERSATYLHQLRAFAAAVLDGTPVPTGGADAIANMTLIDACYRAAGMEPRQPTP